MASDAKKRTPKKRTKRAGSGRPFPLSEMVALLAGAAGVFLLLALLSYHPTDPSWNFVGSETRTANLMGRVGALLSEPLVAFLGVPALVIPVALLGISYSLIRYKMVHWPWVRVAASLALTFFACLLLTVWPGQIFAWESRESIHAGGAVGKLFIGVMQDNFNYWGTLLVIIMGLLFSLQVTLAIELTPLLLATGRFSRRIALGTAGAVGGVASAGASAVVQRAKDGAAAWREAAERRREEEAQREEEYRQQEEEARKEAEAARKEEERKARAERGAARGARGALPPSPPAPGAPANGDPGPRITRHAAPDLEPAGAELPLAPTPAPRPSRGAPVSAAPVAPPDAEDEEDLSALEEAESAEEAAPEAARRPAGRKTPDPLGPRIVKSKYMEEGASSSPGGSYMDAPSSDGYQLPSTQLLKRPQHQEGALSEEELRQSANTLEEKLRDYGVEGHVAEIHPGPVITMYEYAPAPGVKVAKITNLSNDLALALRAAAVRIVAPLPGKAAVGIEVPDKTRQMVYLREILEHEEFSRAALRLPMAIGKDIEGKPYAADMSRMPHLLVAGATGTGKSVAVNAMLISLLYARKPDEVRLILVDPKMIEFSVYENIPHLLMPVVTDPKKAARALNWAVEEMTRRYRLLTHEGARNIASYNQLIEDKLRNWDERTAPEGIAPPRKLPYIVIVIDELADLMLVAGKEVQDYIVRLAQMARAAGIHLVVATQRPSVDVITGLIKANFPARIAFKVSSKTDSRTILDANGAECLLGNGDMLFLPPGSASLMRLHGAFVSDDEARVVIDHLRSQGQPHFDDSLLRHADDDGEGGEDEPDEDQDEFYEEAKRIVLETGQASISTIQRRLKIGYNRSARMVERMGKEGLIGPPTQGGKPREIFAAKLQSSLRG